MVGAFGKPGDLNPRHVVDQVFQCPLFLGPLLYSKPESVESMARYTVSMPLMVGAFGKPDERRHLHHRRRVSMPLMVGAFGKPLHAGLADRSRPNSGLFAEHLCRKSLPAGHSWAALAWFHQTFCRKTVDCRPDRPAAFRAFLSIPVRRRPRVTTRMPRPPGCLPCAPAADSAGRQALPTRGVLWMLRGRLPPRPTHGSAHDDVLCMRNSPRIPPGLGGLNRFAEPPDDTIRQPACQAPVDAHRAA